VLQPSADQPMNNSNPYAPPQSAVADVEVHTDDDVRPKTVNIAVVLLWASAALGIISNVIRMFRGEFPPNVPQIVPILTFALSFAFASWFNIKIATRRNWARITWVVLFAVGLLILLAKPTILTRLSTMLIVLFSAQHLIAIATAVLLLTPTSNRWFKKEPTGTRIVLKP
jgi:hypothetical protein